MPPVPDAKPRSEHHPKRDPRPPAPRKPSELQSGLAARPASDAAAALPLSQLLDVAAELVAAVRAGRSLSAELAAVEPRARPGAQALAFHALRWMGGASAARAMLAPRTPPPWLEGLLLVALTLLWPQAPTLYAPHTVVDQAVACARRRAQASGGFVNAVLRRFLRERAVWVEQLAGGADLVGRYQHPAWWIERLRRDWPSEWEAILAAAQEHPPMTLRVNARVMDAAAYCVHLLEAGLAGQVQGVIDGSHTVVLSTPVPVQRLPGFDQGWVSVQDASAQLAAPLLLGPLAAPAVRSGARVLDACAAPGGKTAHLLELADLDLVAVDSDAQRLARVADTLARVGRASPLPAVQLLAANAGDTAAWWDGRAFDAILLDAPCSASGIVRRHPDVRWLRRVSDIAALAQIQAHLLDRLWPLLKPGGRLVYATCSVFRAEGEDQMVAFLQRTADAIREPAPGHLLPVAHNVVQGALSGEGIRSDASGQFSGSGDGFFYASLVRHS